MAAPRALTNLGPRRLVEEALTLDLISFLARHGDAHLLLVRIPEGDSELELGLSAGAASAVAGPEPLPFRTGHQDPPRAWRSESEKVHRESGGVVAALREASALRRGRAQTGGFGRPLHGPHFDWTRAQ